MNKTLARFFEVAGALAAQHFSFWIPVHVTGILANSEHPYEMPHTMAFHQGLQCAWTEMHHFIEMLTNDPLKCKLNHSILIVSIYMGK